MLLLLLPWSLYAAHIHWFGDYDKALQKAVQEHKPLMVLLVKDGSIACKNIIKNVLTNQPYIQALNEKYVAVIVTYEGRANYPIEMYYSQVFPTLFFVDSRKESFLTKPLYGNDINRSSIEAFLAR